MDELEDLHKDRTNICFSTMEAESITFIVVLFINYCVVFPILMFFSFNNYVSLRFFCQLCLGIIVATF